MEYQNQKIIITVAKKDLKKLDQYQQYIHKSRYARYLPKEKRREHWDETVDRYVDFIQEQATSYGMDESEFPALRKAIKNFDVMPSMRAMMTAGPAMKRCNVCAYNCSYVVIDHPYSFDEAMYILMCGSGVGFSVERQYINKLPDLPDQMFDSRTIVFVEDSKKGWAKALRQIIAILYSGEIPKWDVSQVRPAGAPLKTFGGRASGPEPLEDLFRFVVNVFENAVREERNKLTSIECHDIMCKIGEVVVVGGVRRSAMISLSNLSDDRMRNAKQGEWWHQNVQRSLSNNSAVYTEKPDVGIFMEEWLSIYRSHSGERGIFSRDACKRIAARNERRNAEHEFGTNPCSEIILRPNQFCNLTEVVARYDDTVASLRRKVKLATILGTIQSTFTDFKYLRRIWKKNTEEERLLGVSITGIFDSMLLCEEVNLAGNSQVTNGGPEHVKLSDTLTDLKQVAINTNKKYAKILGIPQATAITCVKPSGTVSQLVDAASGIHTRHAPYYIRRVRADNKDPLTQFMIANGVPNEPDVTKPWATTVFSFPKQAPEHAVCRDDITPIDHLKLWLEYQRYWCEHKPSVTISIMERDWPTVGAWVWEHFDEMSGISFLPFDGGSYRQAPYEEITEEEYNDLFEKMPKKIDWTKFEEDQDNVEGAQTLACVAVSCEV